MKIPVAAALLIAPGVSASSVFLPKRVAFGSGPIFPSNHTSGIELPLRLTPSSPCATLDYGFEVAGQPLFSARAVVGSEAVEVEVKYAESFPWLSNTMSDGPLTWSAPLANTNRVETLRISSMPLSTVTLTQGGQRWQTLCLLRGEGVVFDRIGFRATVPVIKDVATDLPGSFDSSDKTLDAIWALGPRATSVACVAPKSQPQMWSSDPVNGTLVPGIRSGFSYKTWNLSNYILEFDTMITRGGMRVSVAYGIAFNTNGLHLQLAPEYPPSTSYANVNTTLFPPSSVSIAYGGDFVFTQTKHYRTNATVHENAWHKVRVEVDSTASRIVYSLNGTVVFNISAAELPDAETVTDPTFTGAIGFGGWQDQAAYVRNVVVMDRSSGLPIYSNSMKDAAAVRSEFAQQTNAHGVCMDGGKRDRYLWLGDFYHTVRILGVGQGIQDQEAIKGTFEYVFEYQSKKGQFSGIIPISYESPMPTPEFVMAFAADPEAAVLVFPDYALLGLLSFVSFMEYADDIAFAKAHWAQLTRAVNWIDTYKTSSGMLDFSRDLSLFIGAADGVAVNCVAVQAYRGMARVATALDDTNSASTWSARADNLSSAIQTHLWNEDLGVFADTVASPTQYSVAGVAFAVTSGVATKSQALSSLALIDKTLRPASQMGYLDSTTADPADKISPNTNGFLLEAVLQSKISQQAKYLVNSLWTPMLQDKYASGASWEYVAQDGSPGLGVSTSLSHPWGGAATYALTNHVAGIQSVTFGFKTWRIEPQIDIFDLTNVTGRVLTPHGCLTVSWRLNEAKDSLFVSITSPNGTSGVFSVAQPSKNSTFTKPIHHSGLAKFTVPL